MFLVSFAAVIRVVMHRSSPLTAAYSSSAFLSLCYWEPITCMYLLAACQLYFSLHLPPKTRFPEYGSLLLIGQFEERNAELEWAAVSGEDCCVTTLITAAKETSMFFTLVKIKNVYFKWIFYIMLGNEISEVRADFGDTFPGVIGAIDGTLIRIWCPSENKEAYNCRKRFYALNVQVQVFYYCSRSKCHCVTLTVPATVYCIL